MLMSYKQIKWLILIIPTITIGLWEYVRHEFLLPYISMNLGNWLAPMIVFFVTVLFLTQLFSMMEQNQEELNEAKAIQVALQEREQIARELHDGIAQSLFLLAVQMDRMEKNASVENLPYGDFRKTVHSTNAYVREAIANLRLQPNPISLPWMQGLHNLINEVKAQSNLIFEVDWNLPEEGLSAKEKVELLASIRETLLNIYKHANATKVWIEARETEQGWQCLVMDDGIGFDKALAAQGNGYGIKMMQDRASLMNWNYRIEREDDRTVIYIGKEGAL